MSHILGRRKIIEFKGTKDKPGKNVIKIYTDNSCSMAEVRLNNQCMMIGNFHDFHPGCHGGALRVLGKFMHQDWRSYTGLASLIKDYIDHCKSYNSNISIHEKTTCVIEHYTAKYTTSGNWRDIKKK